jgi:hypothetical protein
MNTNDGQRGPQADRPRREHPQERMIVAVPGGRLVPDACINKTS